MKDIFMDMSDDVAGNGGKSVKCRICGSVMKLEFFLGMDNGTEIAWARCPKNCRGGDITQERRSPNLHPIRPFDMESESQKYQKFKPHLSLVMRTLTCAVCGKTVTGQFYPQAKTCSKACSQQLHRVRAAARQTKIARKAKPESVKTAQDWVSKRMLRAEEKMGLPLAPAGV